MVTRHNGKPTACYRDKDTGEVAAVSAICTHLG